MPTEDNAASGVHVSTAEKRKRDGKTVTTRTVISTLTTSWLVACCNSLVTHATLANYLPPRQSALAQAFR